MPPRQRLRLVHGAVVSVIVVGDRSGTVIDLGARPDRVSARSRWCVALAETAANGLDGPDAACWEACLRREEPNLMTALARAERAGRPGSRVTLRLCAALAPFWVINGRWAAGRQRLEQAVAAAGHDADETTMARAHLGLARLSLRLGDFAAASTAARRSLELAHDRNGGPARATGLEVIARIATVTGHHTEAAELLFEVLGLHGDGRPLGVAGCLEGLAGLWLAQQRFLPAARLLGAASAMRAGQGWSGRRLDHHTWEADVAALRRCLAAGEFDTAWKEGERLTGAEAMAYAQRGRGPRQRPSTGWASLTATENEVVRLVREHLTNREIAGRLFISPRTVQTHLSHAFVKLGVATRRELAKSPPGWPMFPIPQSR
jgi:DNA-binding CsgD family transcriptional regulator